MARGHARHAMGLAQAMLIAGLGCRRGVAAASIEGAVMAALLAAGLPRTALHALATSAVKAAEPGMQQAAATLALPLHAMTPEALLAAAPGCVTHSPRVQAVAGVPSLAEAAALAGAGPGATLITPRVAFAREATCALARDAA